MNTTSRTVSPHRRAVFFALLLLPFTAGPIGAADSEEAAIALRDRALDVATDLAQTLLGVSPCHIEVDAFKGRARSAAAHLTFQRASADAFSLQIKTPWGTADLRRSADQTLLVLPDHRRYYVGDGEAGSDPIAPGGFLRRLLGKKASLVEAAPFLLGPLIQRMNATDGALMVDANTYVSFGTRAFTVTSTEEQGLIEGFSRFEVRVLKPPLRSSSTARPPRDYEQRAVDRSEMETMIMRGLARVPALLLPDYFVSPPIKPKSLDHGQLLDHEGQRLIVLGGTPSELGTAHGLLVGDLVRQAVDSMVYLVGFIETVRSGEWFPGVLRDAWSRLSPNIPVRHRIELHAIADAIPNVSRAELELANIFPEYFHCSGFAVFGSATKDGSLFHGRVLDYMTMIGLQDSAVTFVVQPAEGHAFVNVGYPGFIGSVTGMNDQKISLGEMGGAGRGEWDGVPMATLMRRALEECSSLDEVLSLWGQSPRTCEYYYVVADAKVKDAVAVKATPNAFEVLRAGESHPQLGEGIPDTVILSADSRLRVLRERIAAAHGQIDEAAAVRLMDRPVSMSSNLHNALMIPEDHVLLIAHAVGNTPAAEGPYVRYELVLLYDRARALVEKRTE